MDIAEELLQVLDNPARVWDAVLTNLATEPRMSLLILTTCSTPISLVSWQEAVARVSPDAAVRFEASLRVLDDSFVSTYRNEAPHRREGAHYVRFRNPSMDDFCASYLDRNVGIATTVATREPALHQIRRLIELGTVYSERDRTVSFRVRRPKYRNIYEALISRPSVLLTRLLDMLPIESDMSNKIAGVVVTTILTLLSQAARVPEPELAIARVRVTTPILKLRFGSPQDSFLYSALDNAPRARALFDLLEDDFWHFYDSLSDSATTLQHFDSLVNLDEAIDLNLSEADWAERFNELTPMWLAEEMDSSLVESARDTYRKIAEHLGLAEEDRTVEWDEKLEQAEEAEKSEDDGDTWREPRPRIKATADLEARQIDAMFDGLKEINN